MPVAFRQNLLLIREKLKHAGAMMLCILHLDAGVWVG